MARAFCPQCTAEVSVGADGRCENGHLVPGIGPVGGGAHVEEPEPWVARVEPLTTGVDEPTPAPRTSDDLGTYAPEPPAPVPAAVLETQPDDDLDLDALEAAVAELGVEFQGDEDDDALAAFDDQPAPPTSPTTTPLEDWIAVPPTQIDVWEHRADAPETPAVPPPPPTPPLWEPPVASPAEQPEPPPPPTPPLWEPPVASPAEQPEPPPPPPPPAEPPPPAAPVDLGNFTARGAGRGKSKRR